MSALIWDSTTQAFKDADTPKIYSGSSFGDAEGKIWNETAQAWEDAWSSEKILLCPAESKYQYLNNQWTLQSGFTIDSEKLIGSNARAYASIIVDVTKYNYIIADAYGQSYTSDPNMQAMCIWKDDTHGSYPDNVGTYFAILHNRTTYTIDISLVTGSRPVGFVLFGSATLSCWKIWLE